MGYPNEPGRERRATDGLDWRDRLRDDYPPPEVGRSPAPAPNPPRRGVGLGAVAAVALVAALIGGAVSGGAVALFAGGDGDESPEANASGDTGNGGSVTIEQTAAIAEVAANVRPSVVKIESTRQSGTTIESDIGSGVILDSEGHILTNAHVVLNTETLSVVLADGSSRPAILVGHDYPFTDLAVLQVGPVGIQALEVGDSDALRLGETVVAIGNPLSEFEGTVTVGVVSGLNRQREFDNVLQEDLIQTDAAVNSGNSGGALLNLQGQFIGMPTAVLRQAPRGGAPVEGIAFAIPSNRAMEVARTIIETRGNYPRPSAGLLHEDLGPETPGRVRLAVLEGALVVAVEPGGPAETAGIAAEDIITQVGDEPVNEERPFLNALARYAPGEAVRVVLNRNGRIIETEVRLGTRG